MSFNVSVAKRVISPLALWEITSDLAAVNQRLMSPYFGDLAEWLCKAFWQPGRVASSSIRDGVRETGMTSFITRGVGSP